MAAWALREPTICSDAILYTQTRSSASHTTCRRWRITSWCSRPTFAYASACAASVNVILLNDDVDICFTDVTSPSDDAGASSAYSASPCALNHHAYSYARALRIWWAIYVVCYIIILNANRLLFLHNCVIYMILLFFGKFIYKMYK